MKTSSLAAVLACVLALASADGALAQRTASAKTSAAKAAPAESDVRARAVLSNMAQFLAATQSFSVRVRAAYDAVQRSGQRIEFGESRTIPGSRPDRLRVESERSDGTRIFTVFNGREI